MSSLSITDKYSPAYLSIGKQWLIRYTVLHPDTLKRFYKTEKLNHIDDLASRRQYARHRIRELNAKLALGWNPFVDAQAPRSTTPFSRAMDEFLNTKVREGIAEDSIRTYRSQLGIFRRWLEGQRRGDAAVGTLSEDDAIAFLDECFHQRGITPRTFNNYRRFYGTLCLWWVKRKYLRANPFTVVEHKRYDRRKKNRRPLTVDERRQVRSYLQEHHPRFLTFSLLMFHCALRPKEVFYLKPEHFDLERQCIHVLGAFSKNKFDRTAAIPDVLMPMIRSLGIDKQPREMYVFSDGFEPGAVRKRSRYSGTRWNLVRRALQLPIEVKHYSLRDTGAIQLARDGVSRVDAQNHYDHHSSAIHDLYTLQSNTDGNEEVKRKATAF